MFLESVDHNTHYTHSEAHTHNAEVLPEFEVSPSQQEIAFLQVMLFSVLAKQLFGLMISHKQFQFYRGNSSELFMQIEENIINT